MNNIKELYIKIKRLLNELEKILELDKIYMRQFYEDNPDIINNDNFNKNNLDDCNDLYDEDYNIPIKKNNIDKKCVKLYRKLAKILHPDKNPNYIDDFIKMKKAYLNNDFNTLFIYAYDFNIKLKLTEEEINYIENTILEKENLIKEITNKVHWLWQDCVDDLERHILRNEVKNNL